MAEVKTAEQLKDLKSLFNRPGDVNVAVAYVTPDGLNLIRRQIERAIRNEKRLVRFLIGMDSRGFTRPEAVNWLLSAAQKHRSLNVKAIVSEGHETFHTKLFINHSQKETIFLSGSYNLTGAALGSNFEHGVKVTCQRDEPVGNEVLEAFDRLWNRARCLTPELADWYERNCPPRSNDLGSDFREPPPSPPASTETQKLPRWPSLSLAYIMGVIYARGTFEPDMDRITINLKSLGTSGEIEIADQVVKRDMQRDKVRKRIIQEALNCFPGASLYGSYQDANKGREFQAETVRVIFSQKRMLYLDCRFASKTFELLYDAYGRQANAALPPKRIEDVGRSIGKKFLQGYCISSWTIDGKHQQDVLLEQLEKGMGEPAKDVVNAKTTSIAGIRNHRRREFVAIDASEFQKTIGFDEEWLDGLVSQIVARNKANSPAQAARGSRQVRSQTSSRK